PVYLPWPLNILVWQPTTTGLSHPRRGFFTPGNAVVPMITTIPAPAPPPAPAQAAVAVGAAVHENLLPRRCINAGLCRLPMTMTMQASALAVALPAVAAAAAAVVVVVTAMAAVVAKPFHFRVLCGPQKSNCANGLATIRRHRTQHRYSHSNHQHPHPLRAMLW